jgi:septum formation protein
VGIPFVVRTVDVEEVEAGDASAVACENARRKAAAFAVARGDLALGVDTVVALDGRLYGTPRDAAEARAMVSALCGRTHAVVSGLALQSPGGVVVCAEATEATFRACDDALLDWYVATGEWRDRAGAYAIQGAGAALVARIAGDYLNVVGLPLARLLDLRPGLLPG